MAVKMQSEARIQRNQFGSSGVIGGMSVRKRRRLRSSCGVKRESSSQIGRRKSAIRQTAAAAKRAQKTYDSMWLVLAIHGQTIIPAEVVSPVAMRMKRRNQPAKSGARTRTG